MAYFLPHVGTTADEIFTTALDGTKYQLRLRWNSRDEAWYISIGYEGIDPKFYSKFNAGMNILRGHQATEGVPEGAIFLTDSEEIYGRPSRDDTGVDKRFKILYLTKEEYEEVF